jgi:uncharacterized protein (DUF4415 family)
MKKEYDFSTGKRGAVAQTEQGKTRITIRLDNDVLEYFHNKVNEQGGGNYQTMINAILRDHIRQDKPLKEVIRDIIREELKTAA